MKTNDITPAILESSNVPYYEYRGEYGVLIDESTAGAHGIDTGGLEEENGICFLPLGDAPAGLFERPGDTANEVERVDSDLYSGNVPAGDPIVRAECRNMGNGQKLSPRWEEAGFARRDLAERMLDVATDRHYDWESELTRIGRRAARGEDMRREWEEAVREYSCKGMEFTPMTYGQVAERFAAD